MEENGFKIAGGLIGAVATILFIAWMIFVIQASASPNVNFTITTWWMILLVVSAFALAFISGILSAIGEFRSR